MKLFFRHRANKGLTKGETSSECKLREKVTSSLCCDYEQIFSRWKCGEGPVPPRQPRFARSDVFWNFGLHCEDQVLGMLIISLRVERLWSFFGNFYLYFCMVLTGSVFLESVSPKFESETAVSTRLLRVTTRKLLFTFHSILLS